MAGNEKNEQDRDNLWHELTKPENEKLTKEAEGANRKNVENEITRNGMKRF